jgi:hypothetical protein
MQLSAIISKEQNPTSSLLDDLPTNPDCKAKSRA